MTENVHHHLKLRAGNIFLNVFDRSLLTVLFDTKYSHAVFYFNIFKNNIYIYIYILYMNIFKNIFLRCIAEFSA